MSRRFDQFAARFGRSIRSWVRQARIALVDEGTGVEWRALTGAQGDYRFDFVPVGTYRLDVQAPGLRREVLPHLVVEVGRTIVQDFQLEISSFSDSVTIVSEVLLIERSIALGQRPGSCSRSRAAKSW